MDCPICMENLTDDANKAWLVEDAGDALDAAASVAPDPVHKECAVKSIGLRGTLGRKVIGYKVGADKPAAGGLILRK